LSALGEALALIGGRRSYRLDRHKAGLALWARSHWDISGSPASELVWVVAEHKCYTAKLPAIEIAPAPVQSANQGLSYDEPPF
jgi:hypothetical protein